MTSVPRLPGRRAEPDRAGVVDVGVADRLPGDQLVGPVGDDLGVPGDRAAGRRPRLPARVRRVDDADRLQVGHEPRQVLEVAPERVALLGRAVDGERLADVNALVDVVAAEEGVPLVRRVEPEGGVHLAIAGRGPVEQEPAEDRQGQPAGRPLAQARGQQRRAADAADQPLAGGDVRVRVTLFLVEPAGQVDDGLAPRAVAAMRSSGRTSW